MGLEKGLNLSLIIMAAGDSNRFRSLDLSHRCPKKQWLRIGTMPLWQMVTHHFLKLCTFNQIIVVANPQEVDYMKNFCEYEIIAGGQTRQQSLQHALIYVKNEFVLVSDVARWNLDEEVLKRLFEALNDRVDCIAPVLEVPDTVVCKKNYIDRETLKLIQTPQLSRTKILQTALKSNKNFTDESSAIAFAGGNVSYVKGSSKLAKLTQQDDLKALKELTPPTLETFTGNGFDVHSFEKGKKMILGGVEIESDFGFAAHSDGDVALHALCDALLGGIGAGDIGEWFPDTDMTHKGANSALLLQKIYDFVISIGFELVNADVTIIAQTPKISPYKDKIRQKIAEILYTSKFRINIKATTTEHLGFIGRKEGVGVLANVNLKCINWQNFIKSSEI